jgi:hypothetical protein
MAALPVDGEDAFLPGISTRSLSLSLSLSWLPPVGKVYLRTGVLCNDAMQSARHPSRAVQHMLKANRAVFTSNDLHVRLQIHIAIIRLINLKTNVFLKYTMCRKKIVLPIIAVYILQYNCYYIFQYTEIYFKSKTDRVKCY